MVIFWSCKKAVFYKSKIERETGFYEGVGPDLQVEIIFYMADPKREGELQKRPSLVRLRAQIYLLVHEIFYLAEPKEKRTTAKEAGFGEAVGPDMSTCARYFLHG